MDGAKLSKSVKRITVLKSDGSGGVAAVTVYERDPGKKKGRRLLKPLERAARYMAEAQADAANDYLARHKKSNTKKRDGWIRDIGANVIRASKKGSKAVKVNRLYSV